MLMLAAYVLLQLEDVTAGANTVPPISYSGHASLVTVLLTHGADPNRLNDRGQSPLAGAIFKKEDDVVKALLEGGADPDWGAPTARDCLKMFKQEDQWGAAFDGAKGKGKGGEVFVRPAAALPIVVEVKP